jgi:hypothetical protein
MRNFGGEEMDFDCPSILASIFQKIRPNRLRSRLTVTICLEMYQVTIWRKYICGPFTESRQSTSQRVGTWLLMEQLQSESNMSGADYLNLAISVQFYCSI